MHEDLDVTILEQPDQTIEKRVHNLEQFTINLVSRNKINKTHLSRLSTYCYLLATGLFLSLAALSLLLADEIMVLSKLLR